jgi:elongation factor G
MAIKKAAKRPAWALLEPLMKLEVTTPEEYLGDVMGDLSAGAASAGHGRPARRAGGDHRGRAPGHMFGYATDLRSATQGRATFTHGIFHYEPVPASLAEEVLEEGQPKKGGQPKEVWRPRGG